MAKPARVTDVLTDLPQDSELTQDARESVRVGLRLSKYTPSPLCPCERCHRIYRTIP